MKLKLVFLQSKHFFSFVFITALVGIITVTYRSQYMQNVPDYSLTQQSTDERGILTTWKSSSTKIIALKNKTDVKNVVENDIQAKHGSLDFDINGSDVLVFLHIQKTGGSTFGHQLVDNIKLDKKCVQVHGRKRSKCLRPNSDKETWIFSRFSTGWACGLHSDWTELQECVADKLMLIEKVDKIRRFFYITVLREPVSRYISEWRHVQRSATWKKSKHSCNNHPHAVPFCFTGEDWTGVTLKEFMSCPYNMANNRQTRMLADLRLVKCYDRWLNKDLNQSEIVELEEFMLESAMENLKEMSFFGLLEEQVKTQYIFENTFPFEFIKDFFQVNETRTVASIPLLSEEEREGIAKLNYLDVRLYEYAVKIFQQRYKES